MSNKFHSLLASKTDPSLIQNLKLPPNEEKTLVESAREIRKVIIAGIRDLREELRKHRVDDEIPTPKFAIQGSYIYGTLNAPAFPPKQQVDIDLGVYLPFNVLGDGQRPKLAATYYFDVITTILQNHIINNRHGEWRISPEPKDTCVRVNLNEKTHIDLPLYAVPENEFSQVTEDATFAKALNSQVGMEASHDEFSMEALMVERVDPSVIHLAHRELGWTPSDALAIRSWVQQNFSALGSMIKPTNRFLKAWRDQKWQDGGEPSSILILAHTIKTYPKNTNGTTHCEVLEKVIDTLPNIFEQPLLVPCPKPNDKYAMENLLDRIKPDKKIEYKAAFTHLKAQYTLAKQTSVERANSILVSLFGDRMPTDTSRIVVVDDVSVEESRIRSTEPDIKPLYTTERSTSG